MNICSVNQNRCIGCGTCAFVCPTNLFSGEKGENFFYADPNGWCTGCGHCIAVCPEEAIMYEDRSTIPSAVKSIPDVHATIELLKSKRSLRNYLPDQVRKKDLETVIEAMSCASTGHNSQNVDFCIVTDSSLQQTMREITISALKAFRKVMRFHLLLKLFTSKTLYELMSDKSVMAGIDDMVERYNNGEDPIFFNAPVVVVGHNPDLGEESFVDSSIGFTYGMLAGHAMGLESCWMGFAMMALKKHKKMHKLLTIPNGNKITAIMTLGYAAVSYKRVPTRKKRNIVWL